MRTYLLPCSCSAEIPVGAGQAGGRVRCAACGREVEVPKLRDLAGLRERERTETARRAWTAAHAWLLAALTVAGVAWLGSFAVLPRSAAVYDEAVARRNFSAANTAEVYRMWKQGLANAGVRRPPTAEEQRLLQQAQFSGGVSSGLRIVGTLAIPVACAAAAWLFLRRGTDGPRPPAR